MNENQILSISQIITSSLSLIASLLVLLIYTFAKPLRIFAFKIIFWLSLSHFIRSISQLSMILLPKHPLICQIDAYIFYSSSLSILLWTFIIAYKLYQSIILNNPDMSPNYYTYILTISSVSFSLCALPFAFGEYEQSGPDCLLGISTTGEILRLVLFFIPAFVVAIYCFVVYTRILRSANSSGSRLEKDSFRLRYFTLILIVCVTPLLVSRVSEYFGMFNFYLYCFSYNLMNLQGLFDAVAYGFTPPVIRYFKLKFMRRSRSILNESDLFSLLE